MALPGRLIGGPLDGGSISAAARPNFVWVSSVQQSFRVFTEPAAGRMLYRKAGEKRGGIPNSQYEAWLFAGHSHAYCYPKGGGCGGYNDIGEGEKNPRCQLCDTPLVRPSDRLPAE